MRMRLHFILIATFLFFNSLQASSPKLPKEVRGFCIAAPSYSSLDFFINFIENELAPRKVNVLIMRVDYNYR